MTIPRYLKIKEKKTLNPNTKNNIERAKKNHLEHNIHNKKIGNRRSPQKMSALSHHTHNQAVANGNIEYLTNDADILVFTNQY